MFDVFDPKIGGAVKYVVEEVLACPDVRSSHEFLSPRLTVKATRHGKWTARDAQRIIIVTVGRPNYRERKMYAKNREPGASLERYQDRMPKKGRKKR